MLLSLQIENYAIIKSLNLRLDKGFTVITGETGAGKSILVGALSLILGQRAENTIFYDKSKKCYVEAQFDIDNINLNSFFEKNNLDYQRYTIIRREVYINGKSRAFVNDTPVTLQTLREITEKLVDIHSQHHHLFLQQNAFRLKVIDSFCENTKLLEQYRKHFFELKNIDEKFHQLKKNLQQQKQEIGYWEYVVNEIDNANLKANEQEELEHKISFLSNATEIKNSLYESSQILSEQEGSVLSMLETINQNCRKIISYYPDIQSFTQRLDSTIRELKDISYEISKMETSVEANPDVIDSLRERLDLIYTFQQKHRLNSIEELLLLSENMKNRIDEYSLDEQRLADLEDMQKTKREDVRNLATQLSYERNRIAPILAEAILEKLKLLGMENTFFKISLRETENFGEFGMNEADFLFSANIGSEAVEIEKVASGGEIARVMLALKSAITERALLPTVIFDEIDTGVSGDVASKVALLMAQIAKQRQLITITHLPQIAAKGEIHYKVYKKIENKQTETVIKKIEDNERVHEIAKMMSGQNITDTSLKAANELIEMKIF